MAVVTKIPATKNKFTSASVSQTHKRRVAAYARVSTDKEEQITSYKAQVDYYKKYIQNNDEWEYVDVYADEGITGTSTKSRKRFQEMIDDALAGKIDLIITKSVSRFARNTVDTLVNIRKLKDAGVECFFEEQGIWTFDSTGELMITMLSSIAQEEARNISENVTWGHRKRFEDGKIMLAYKRFLGYDRGEDGKPVINPEEAEIVRQIYRWFIEGKTPFMICKALESLGIKTPGEKDKWQRSTVISILSNALKVCGSLPMFYNSFNGFASSLIGDILVNRRCRESRRALIEKAKRVLELGTDLIIFPEGGWNKTSEKITLDLWAGVYEIAGTTGCDVVPIVHYNREPEVLRKSNVIHTVVGEPIPLYQMEKEEALRFLRDTLSTYQYKMMDRFGQSTRQREIQGFATSHEKWEAHLTERMKSVEYYDVNVEKNSEYRPKYIIRPEDVFEPIAAVQNVTALNIKHVLYARKLVSEEEQRDYQTRF